jgi:hypothetical protein
MATAEATEIEVASAQLKARLAELPGSITDEQLDAMDVKAFTALCNTIREHVQWDEQRAMVSDLTKRYLALCKDPSKLVEALLSIKNGDPERGYRSATNPLHRYSQEVLDFNVGLQRELLCSNVCSNMGR